MEEKCILISIHAPARGATPAGAKAVLAVQNFNSRPCERGDKIKNGDYIDLYLISIHAPARGATAKLNKISVKFTEIIIKTEWEFKQYSSYGY